MPRAGQRRVGVGQAGAGRRPSTSPCDVLRPDRPISLEDLGGWCEMRPPRYVDLAHRGDPQARAVEAELPTVIATGEHAVGDPSGIQRDEAVRAARSNLEPAIRPGPAAGRTALPPRRPPSAAR